MARLPRLRLAARPLARRLIFWTVVFSGTLALVITLAQLYVEYRRDVDVVEQRFEVIERGYLPSIVDAVWVADPRQLATLLDGIVSLPDFAYAEVVADGSPLATRGAPTVGGGISRTWPLLRTYRSREIAIGELTIRADLASARQRFVERAVFIVAANVIKTVLVAFFMLLLVDRLVTRHLEKIADYLARSSPRQRAEPLALDRPPRDDELARVVATLNRLRTDIERHHGEMTDVNAQLEQRVAARTAALEHINRELESFSYSVSHDLQAPLRAISGYADILLEDEREHLSPEGRQTLDRMIRSARRMSDLIANILQYSRAARVSLNKRKVQLGTLARDVATRLAADYPAARVQIGELPAVYGDPTMLEQVLQNLIGNALKYSSKRPSPKVEIGVEAREGRSVFFVKDNGAGFDMRYADKLFGMFQRMHSENEFPGTGVGLAIVKRLIERHGGEVWAEAEPDRGARFYFTLGTEEA